LVLHFDLAFGVGAEGSAGCGLAGSVGGADGPRSVSRTLRVGP
jgi:hypothetical protein